MDGVRIIVEIGVRIKRVNGEWRHVGEDKNRGVRMTGIRIFNIY